MKIITQQTHIIQDNGEIIEYFGNKLQGLLSETKEKDPGEWSCQFGFQYDNEDFSIVFQGEIFETMFADGSRASISIIGVDFRAYLDGDELERFTINGLDEIGIISELELYL